MEQQKEIKFFGNPTTGRLNSDDADFSLGPDEWTNAENVRTGTTDAGVINTVESIGSTQLLSAPSPSVTFFQIGAAEDAPNNRFCYFLYNVYGDSHKIVCYDANAGVIYDVLLSSQVTGGLNFSKDYPIHSARIVNNMLYWVEGDNNEPRKINIDSGILLNNPSYDSDAQPYVAPLSFDQITIIKPPPQLAPNIQKAEDATFINNFIANASFEFAFLFDYYDNEQSVIGPYSPASRLSIPGDTYNYIAVQMDSLQIIPSTVKSVSLVVRLGNTNNANIIKTWDKDYLPEALEIENQNNSVAQLTFNFYNNITGETIPADYVLKPFDNVPNYAWALEMARNRLFLANVEVGYDTPVSTSMEITQNITGISGITSVVKPVYQVRVKVGVPGPDNDYVYAAYYVYMSATDISVPGYYLIDGTVLTALNQPNLESDPVLPAPPVSTSVAGITFSGTTQTDVTNGAAAPNINEAGAFFNTSYLITITGTSSTVDNVMKSRSSYKAGMVFYDKYMRKCGVVTNDGLVINIESRNFAYSVATRSLTWTVYNEEAAVEIPVWAYYYAPVRTLNLRTRYFIDSFDNAAKYATKDADGNYEFTNDSFIPSVVGIGIDTTALVQAGLGYVYTQGDVAILIDDANNVYELPVVGQQGSYIVVSSQDIGDLSTKKIIYEIYTPYQTSEQEPFFEIGQVYPVSNPGTADRQYSITTDLFVADTYTIARNFDTDTYIAEAMSPNDLFYQTWENDGGKPNFIVKGGHTSKPNFIYWSNTFIPGTSVNGLSTFDPLSQTNVPEECGPIEKIILTSKVQDEGTVMLGVCNTETVSLYLGETQILDNTGATQFFSGSTGVIGTINVLKGSYGTMNPESVVEFRGSVFWLDVANGKVIQYASNGLFAISNYKMTRFWKLFCDLYMATSAQAIEDLGGRPFIFTTVDPHHMELLFSIPKLSATPPKGYLPDYPSTIYPFDIWDAQGKTIVYKLENGAQPPHWQGAYSFNPEGFMTMDNDLFSFKYGQLYKHNLTTSFNEFYGVQYKSKIMFVSNMVNKVPKVYNSMSVEANMVPNLVYVYAESPYQQSSDLEDISFRELEGVPYATFLRNKLVPTAEGFTTDGLLTGERIRTAALKMMVQFVVTNTPVELRFINILFSISSGHKTV